MRFLTSPAHTHDPFAQLGRLRHEMERFFERTSPAVRDHWTPPMSLHETESAFEVRVPVPGAEPEGLEIQLEQNVLQIAGERAGVPEDATRRYVGERPTGRFRRAIELPSVVDGDAVSAELHDGILRVTLPKAPESLPRRIAVSV